MPKSAPGPRRVRRPHRPGASDSPPGLLDRILDTPQLTHVVPRLQPELLHRVIQNCGLEDCGELVALATSDQLSRMFDLDLWRAGRPGLDEQFDADRFGVWLEVLVECGADVAAQKLAGMNIDLVVAGLSRHVRVYDSAAVTPHTTTDGEAVTASRARDEGLTCEVGGCLLAARRVEMSNSWEAIVAVLTALEAEHRDYFRQVIRGCRRLSNSGKEIDGLDDLLADDDQQMFDVAVGREHRREKQGYATPGQARAFLQMSREFRPAQGPTPSANPVARAYFRAMEDTSAQEADSSPLSLPAGSGGAAESAGEYARPAQEPSAETVAAIVEVLEILREAGIVADPPRALLEAPQDQTSRLGHIRAHMQFVLDRDPAGYAARSGELAYLANTLMAGCSIQGRVFTEHEATSAVVAICNLGLENWPSHDPMTDDVRLGQDLLGVFQHGWSVLHENVCMFAAEQLVGVLTHLACGDREIQMELSRLRSEMTRHWKAGAPWQARNALEAIAVLDQPAWATLLGLIDECPVIHGAIVASQGSRARSVSASAFEFISENSQIAAVRAFMQSLPEILREAVR